MREEWLKRWYRDFERPTHFLYSLFHQEEEIEREERNDVYIYKTLRYPPKSKSPKIN
jgi:hypothetical protein